MKQKIVVALFLVLVAGNVGCATTSEPAAEGTEAVGTVYDPWEPMNRNIYRFNANFDKYVFLPLIRGYRSSRRTAQTHWQDLQRYDPLGPTQLDRVP